MFYQSTPPPKICAIFLAHRHKGSAFLALVLVMAIVSSLFSLGSAKVTQAAMNGTSSNQTSAEASQIAQSDAELLRSVSYQDVAPSSRKAVEGTPFQHEMTVSSESDFNSSVKQKTVTIKVFKGAETNPRSELRLTRYSAEQTASGVPIGTVIAWFSTKNPADGTWLECNGQSCAGYAELVSVLGRNIVPDLRGKFLEGDATPWKIIDAGLPNITGHFRTLLQDASSVYCDGAFTYSWVYVGENGNRNGAGETQHVYLNASRSSSIYGKSTTVQPPAVTVRWLIKAA